jgi:hypothetical protein
MTQFWRGFPLLLFFIVTLAGCEFIGDVFQAGVWVGVIGVFAVIGLIVWFVSKGRT